MMSLVLFHGFTGSPQSFAPLLASLGEPPLLAPALVGHTGIKAPEIHCFEEEVDRLADLVRGAGFSGACLVGYSLGARIALGLLVRHPALFASAVLVGVHPGLESETERRQRRAADERWCALLETQGLEAFVNAWQAQTLFASQRRLAQEILERQRRERLSHTARGLAQSLRTTGLAAMPCYLDRVRDIEAPVTLVVGALDTKFSVLSERMAPHLQRGQRVVVAGAGHNVLLEQPEALVELLRAEAA